MYNPIQVFKWNGNKIVKQIFIKFEKKIRNYFSFSFFPPWNNPFEDPDPVTGWTIVFWNLICLGAMLHLFLFTQWKILLWTLNIRIWCTLHLSYQNMIHNCIDGLVNPKTDWNYNNRTNRQTCTDKLMNVQKEKHTVFYTPGYSYPCCPYPCHLYPYCSYHCCS